MKALICQLNSILGDIAGNIKKVQLCLQQAEEKKASLVVFPEMVLCGYPPEDLLLRDAFVKEVEQALEAILPYTYGKWVVIGTIRKSPGEEKSLYNTAAILSEGKIVGFKDKTLLPTYDVFDEKRYFSSGKEQKVFSYQEKKIGVTICEDIWTLQTDFSYTRYSIHPLEKLKQKKPDYVINLSASPYHFQKSEERLSLLKRCASFLGCPFLWCNQVGMNDSLVFDGYSCVITPQQEIRAMAKGFEEELLVVDLSQEKREASLIKDPIEELYQALVLGVKDYFVKQGFSEALLGLSGGVDSAVVACIAKEALGSSKVKALAMPSCFTSKESKEEAKKLAEQLQIELLEIPIDMLWHSFLQVLEPFYPGCGFDHTEENLQARIRGMLLMAFSNKLGPLVLSTGNKSEMAMGYTTLYGDMCGALGVIQDVTKTKVYQLAKWIQKQRGWISETILQRLPSAELRENQKDADTLPPYDWIDIVVEEYEENFSSVEEIVQKHKIPKDQVERMLHKLFQAEYKRRQAPIGIRVSKKAFGMGRRIPIMQKWNPS